MYERLDPQPIIRIRHQVRSAGAGSDRVEHRDAKRTTDLLKRVNRRCRDSRLAAVDTKRADAESGNHHTAGTQAKQELGRKNQRQVVRVGLELGEQPHSGRGHQGRPGRRDHELQPRAPRPLRTPEAPLVFETRHVRIPAGVVRAYDPAEWRGALIVVERGVIELECLCGARGTFVAGDVLYLDRLPLRRLRNRTAASVILSATRRVHGTPAARHEIH